MPKVLKIHANNLSEEVVRDLKEHYGNAELEIHVREAPGAAEVMEEEEFWSLIAQLDWSDPDSNDQVIEPVVEQLSGMPVAKIYQFQDILSHKLWLLDTRAHAEAMMRNDPDDYFSDDEFLYARSCVVANGRVYFHDVLTNPSQFPTDLTFEDLLYVAGTAYKRKTGKNFQTVPAYNFETGSNQNGWQ